MSGSNPYEWLQNLVADRGRMNPRQAGHQPDKEESTDTTASREARKVAPRRNAPWRSAWSWVPLLVGSNADESSLARADPPDTDVDAYQASAREKYGRDAERFLDLYPGGTEEQVLDSLLRSQTDQVMTRAMHRWAHLQTQTGRAPVYLYFFTHTPPDKGLERYGAYHGAEVMYAYDNLGNDGNADYGPADYRLRDQMRGYWLNFVRHGDPNGPGLPAWPTVRHTPGQVMELGTDSGMAPRPRPDAIDFWMSYDGPIP